MSFTVHGIPVSDIVSPVSRITKFLDTLPFEQLITAADLRKELSLNDAGLRRLRSNTPLLQEYSHTISRASGGSQTLWGSKKSICKFKKQDQELRERISNANND